MERMVSASMSAASLGSKRMEGRVKGLLRGASESACTRDLMACNCAAIEVAMAVVVEKPCRRINGGFWFLGAELRVSWNSLLLTADFARGLGFIRSFYLPVPNFWRVFLFLFLFFGFFFNCYLFLCHLAEANIKETWDRT